MNLQITNLAAEGLCILRQSHVILIQCWHPLGKLKSLLHSLEEWKAFILFLATSLTCWKSLKLEMASSNGFKCASFSSSLHKLKKSDHHLSILWSPLKSAWEVVTPISSNVPPYSLYFNDFLNFFPCLLQVWSKTFWKIETANAIFWMYLGGTA